MTRIGLNVVQSGGSYVTVGGLSFGLRNHTPSAILGGEASRTLGWTSSTAVVCRWGSNPVSHETTLTVAAVAGTGAGQFTFDAPGTTLISINAAVTNAGASLLLTLSGMNFGTVDLTPSGGSSGVSCLTAGWSSPVITAVASVSIPVVVSPLHSSNQ